MIFQLTQNGMTIQTYQEIYDELAAGYKAIYGANIDVLPNSPDGQRIGIEAKARLDAQTTLLSLYNQHDPDFATGENLNKLIKLNGITRGVPTRSQVAVDVTTDRLLTIQAGYTVADSNGQSWVTDSVFTLNNGVTTITMFAKNFGNVIAAPNTITNPSTIVLGVVSVTNPSAAIAGQSEETDSALRIRRQKSLASPANSTFGGLYSALANLIGVTDLQVYENNLDTVDVALNMQPHSIWCIVEGGDIADITMALAKNRTAGVATKGAVSGVFTEVITKPDGTTFNYLHNMNFDRPTVVPLYVTLTVQPIGGAIVDIVGIQNAIAARTYSIGEIARASNLYASVYGVGNNFTATLLSISRDNVSFVSDIIASGANEVFSIIPANIVVTQIP